MSTPNDGTAVTITAHSAGVIAGKDGAAFVGKVKAGTRGTYAGPHPTERLAADGWHLVRVDTIDVDELDGSALAGRSANIGVYAPLHSSQFTAGAAR